jgi:hypothetical protein
MKLVNTYFVAFAIIIIFFFSQEIKVTKGNNLEYLMSSTFQLSKLFNSEVQFVAELKAYLTLLKDETTKISAFVDKNYGLFEEPKGIEDVEAYISHPVNAFGMIKRTSVAFIKGQLNFDPSSVIMSKMNTLKELSDKFPTKKDYSMACHSLALLKETYDLQTSDLAIGLVRLNSSSSIFKATYKMDSYDLSHIGTHATNQGWVNSGLEWLELAVKVRL